MEMRITHADDTMNELRFIDILEKLDAQVSIAQDAVLVDNSLALIVPESAWEQEPILIGHYLYIDGTEWGGPIEAIKHNTEENTLTLTGPTWRGMMMRKIIEPPAGEDYFTVSGEANSVIASVVGTMLGSLFAVSTENIGVSISISARYKQLLTTLESALEAEGLTLGIQFDATQGKVFLAARTVVDYSGEIDLSQDYNIEMISTEGRLDGYNHVIALGAGELKDRDVANIYRLDDGTITDVGDDPPAWAGTELDKELIYDFTNPESMDDLIQGAQDRLQEYAPKNGIELDPGDADITLELGDIVGARDRLTGLSTSARITEKILTIDRSGIKIKTKVA